jgi:hypothetical protein
MAFVLPKVLDNNKMDFTIVKTETLGSSNFGRAVQSIGRSGGLDFKILVEFDFLDQCREIEIIISKKDKKETLVYYDKDLLNHGVNETEKYMTNQIQVIINYFLRKEK